MSKRVPYAVARCPLGRYDCAPAKAFEPVKPGQVEETYPLMKNHVVVATGTKTECLRALRLIRQEEKATRTPEGFHGRVPVERVLEILRSMEE